MDLVWKEGVGDLDLPEAPSSTPVAGFGAASSTTSTACRPRRRGMEPILFETDYPHSDGTFPNSRRRAWELSSKAGLDAQEVFQLVRGNAIDVYGLQRFGIERGRNKPSSDRMSTNPALADLKVLVGRWRMELSTLPSCPGSQRAHHRVRSRWTTGWRMAPPW